MADDRPTLAAHRRVPCGPTGDEMFCACGCGGDDSRCAYFMRQYDARSEVDDAHTCCKTNAVPPEPERPVPVVVSDWDSIDDAVMHAADTQVGRTAWNYDVHVHIVTFRHSDQVKRIEVNHEQRIIWLWGADDPEDDE